MKIISTFSRGLTFCHLLNFNLFYVLLLILVFKDFLKLFLSSKLEWKVLLLLLLHPHCCFPLTHLISKEGAPLLYLCCPSFAFLTLFLEYFVVMTLKKTKKENPKTTSQYLPSHWKIAYHSN